MDFDEMMQVYYPFLNPTTRRRGDGLFSFNPTFTTTMMQKKRPLKSKSPLP